MIKVYQRTSGFGWGTAVRFITLIKKRMRSEPLKLATDLIRIHVAVMLVGGWFCKSINVIGMSIYTYRISIFYINCQNDIRYFFCKLNLENHENTDYANHDCCFPALLIGGRSNHTEEESSRSFKDLYTTADSL